MSKFRKSSYQSKRTGEMMVKSSITLPEKILDRLDNECQKKNLTRAGMLAKILDKSLPS
ncbi:MAG: hypothetical protein HQM14_06825 [SAR324 cluster bacterium]|nr:hypothetical protein [SAR324 cluster bacterium]